MVPIDCGCGGDSEFLSHTASCIYEVDDIAGVSTIVPHMELGGNQYCPVEV